MYEDHKQSDAPAALLAIIMSGTALAFLLGVALVAIPKIIKRSKNDA